MSEAFVGVRLAGVRISFNMRLQCEQGVVAELCCVTHACGPLCQQRTHSSANTAARHDCAPLRTRFDVRPGGCGPHGDMLCHSSAEGGPAYVADGGALQWHPHVAWGVVLGYTACLGAYS